MPKIPLSKIRRDGKTQARFTVYPDVVRDYAEDMLKFECLGTPIFPKVLLYFDGDDYWLTDGFHRLEAAEKVGLEEIDADIIDGTQREARLHAAGANQGHGLQRTPIDKRCAVRVLMEDDEWSQWSDERIAEHCGVSASLVAEVREEFRPTSGGGKSAGLRKGKDGRVINTTNIGKNRGKDTHAKYNPPVEEVEAAPQRPRPSRQTTIEEELTPKADVPFVAPPEANGTPPEPVSVSQEEKEEALTVFASKVKEMRAIQLEYKAKKDKELTPRLRASEAVVDAALIELLPKCG